MGVSGSAAPSVVALRSTGKQIRARSVRIHLRICWGKVSDPYLAKFDYRINSQATKMYLKL